MKRFQNLHLADRSLFTQYRTLFKTDIPAAQNILENTQLQTKLLRASQFNDTTGRVATVENYYYDNIPQKLYNLQEQMTEDAQSIKYVGEYSTEQTYYFNNIVSLNNELYYCKIASATSIQGVSPTNTDSWVYLGLQGNNGFPGLGVTLKGIYNSGELYNAKDVVSYNNRLWIANQTFMGQPPSDNSSYWVPFLNQEPRKINITDSNLLAGDILWKEI